MSDDEFCEHLNKHLWTYSQKQFIPHGSKSDPLPEIQPVYLTDTLENINNSTAAIMVNCNVEMMRNVFGDLKKLEKLAFERLILIFSLDDNSLEAELKIIKQGLLNSQINFDYFKQNASGWIKESN
jgi:DNA polymerase-3 subunit chi